MDEQRKEHSVLGGAQGSHIGIRTFEDFPHCLHSLLVAAFNVA